jgi:dTDP-4-dehydrorhamnose 3,5-epimerase
MRFLPTKLSGAVVIELEKQEDERGFFARTYCAREFAAHDLICNFVQCNLSFNKTRGTVRGLHYQKPPHAEIKLARCTRGSIFDVIVDLRPQSPTFADYFAVELTAENRLSLYIPAGFAHGFQSLQDGSEVFYQMGDFYEPGSSSGLRYDDPRIGIRWPLPVSVISEKDLDWPTLSSWQNPF